MIIAYAAFNADPINSTQRTRTEGLIDLPGGGTPIYSAAVDTTDPAASFSFVWSILYPRDGQTATPADPAAQSTTLENIAAVWGDVRAFVVATNTATGEQSESDPRLAPASAFVTLKIESERRALTLPAIGSRAWAASYDELAAALEALDIDTARIDTAAINAGGDLIITLDDGTAYNAGRARGADGADGENGVSVTGATIDSADHLILDLSDGATIDAGELPTTTDTRRHIYTAGPLYHYTDGLSPALTPLNPAKAVYIAGPYLPGVKITLEEMSISLLDGGAAGASSQFELVTLSPAQFNGALAPTGATLGTLTLTQGSTPNAYLSGTLALSGQVFAGEMFALVMYAPESAINGLTFTLRAEE